MASLRTYAVRSVWMTILPCSIWSLLATSYLYGQKPELRPSVCESCASGVCFEHDQFCEDLAKTIFKWNSPCCEEDGGDGDEEDILVTDRPDFTEASSTVGLGRVQFEVGYTYSYDNDGTSGTSVHTYPEMLARIGMFRDWFEFRIAWTMVDETVATGASRVTSVGTDDLYLGIKLALTEQCGLLPEMAIIPQMNVPSGSNAFTTGEVMPGVNWLYSWEIHECLSIGGSTQGNRVLDDSGHFYSEYAQSFTAAFQLTDKLGGYTEWYGIFPHSAIDPGARPVHIFNGGFTWLVHNNLQYDVRAGVGLNDAAEDYFIGTGFSVRY